MIHIKEGNYHTLTEVTIMLGLPLTNKIKISRIAKKLGLGLRLGRLSVRFHDDEVKIIRDFFDKTKAVKMWKDNNRS